jgi:hypothetical protein
MGLGASGSWIRALHLRIITTICVTFAGLVSLMVGFDYFLQLP